MYTVHFSIERPYTPQSIESSVYTIDLARPTIDSIDFVDSPTFRRLDRLGSDDDRLDRLRRLGLYIVSWPKLQTWNLLDGSVTVQHMLQIIIDIHIAC